MQKFNEDGVPIFVASPRTKQSNNQRRSWYKFVSAALCAALIVQMMSPLSVLANPFNPYVWAVEFTGGGTHQAIAHGLDVDATHLYNVGIFQGTVSFNGPTNTSNSQRDVYVAKIDPATGIPVWTQTSGSNNIDEGWDVAVDDATGDVYASGRFRNRMYIRSAITMPISISATGTAPDGLSLGDYDAFVYKLDTSGDPQWGVGFGDTSGQDIVLASEFGAGGIHTTGRVVGTVDFDPGAGTANLTTDNSGDMFVYKLDPDGNYLWADNLTALSGTGGQDITVDADGNVYTVGYFRGAPQNFTHVGNIGGGRDILIVKHDVNGALQWVRGFGGPEQGTGRQDVAYGVAVDDTTGDIYVTGTFRDMPDFDPGFGFIPLTSVGGQDVFVMSMDSSGSLKWAKSVGGAGDDVGWEIALDSSNGVYISGVFSGSVDFDPGEGTVPLTSKGDDDVFVLVLDKLGNYVSVNQLGGANTEESLGLAVDDAATPSIYTSGSFFGPGNFDPDPNNPIDDLNGSPFIDGFIARLSSNQTPLAVDDEFTVNEDDPTTNFDLLANGDLDPDGAPVAIVAIGMPDMGGTAVMSGTTGVDYTPAPDFFGTEVFTYTITDGAPFGFSTAVVTMTVTGVNDDPLAIDDTAETDEDTPITLNVLTNDFDHMAGSNLDGGQILQIANVGGTTEGGTLSLTGSPPSQIVFSPAQDFVGTDVFTYTLSDSTGGFDTGVVTVTMNAINDTPLAIDDVYTLTHPLFQEPLLPLGNDSDVEGDTMEISAIGVPSNGGIVVADSTNPTTQLNYTPQPTFFGTETITYTVSDGSTTATATIFINIVQPNSAPTAVDDTPTVAEDSTTAISVLGNDTDPDSDMLSISAVGTPDNGGSAALNGTDVDYTPAADFVGTETFTYTISDGKGGSDAGLVTVTVDNVNDDPTAASDTYTVTEDSALTALNVTVNDDIAPDTGETLTVSAVSAPDNAGTATANGADVDYTPAAGFFGTETFTYTVADGNGGSATATVTVNVTEIPNNAPIAVDDAASILQDTTLAGSSVLDNDSDPDDDTLTIDTTPVTDVANGTLALMVDGTYAYTPTAGYVGMDSFVYQIDDGNGLSATATVNITVTMNPNTAPVAVDDAASVVQDTVLVGSNVMANDSDPEDDTLTIDTTPVTDVENGTLVLSDSGVYTYTPDAEFVGVDSFEYQIDDGNGMTDTAIVTINVTGVVAPPNNAPDAVDDIVSIATGATLTDDVTTNDVDQDDDTLTVNTTPVTGVSNGVLQLNADGTFSYTPNAEFDGSDSFVYEVSDGNGGTDTATVNITVIPTGAGNRPPVSSTNGVINATTSEDGTLSGSLLAGINDLDNDPLSVNTTPVQNVENGQLVLNSDGTYDYVPNPGFVGQDSFEYEISDNQGGTVNITVNIDVIAAPSTNVQVYLPTVIQQ